MITLLIRFLMLVLIAIGLSPLNAQIGEMQFPEGSVQHVVLASEIQWMPCPPNLPSGCQLAALEGSPKSNDLFTVRFKVDEGMVMPPHTHPKDERVTRCPGIRPWRLLCECPWCRTLGLAGSGN